MTHNNLAVVLLKLGDPDGAVREFRAATECAPDYFEAHLELGRLLTARRENADATTHLRIAAQSSDPRVRETANNLLRRQP